MLTSDFDYELPAAAIAQVAIEPRDAARLLRTADLTDHRFSDIPGLLRSGDLLVVNRTKVRHARLAAERVGTGGAVELLLLRPLGPRWEALARPSRRLRPGVELRCGPIVGTVVTKPVAGRVELEFSDPAAVEKVMAEHGEVPLPPYFHGELSDPGRYQTVFATSPRSAAAPTAALHFTVDLIESLGSHGVEIAEVELDVGLDTFRPMSEGPIADHEIHREEYFVPEEVSQAVAAARAENGRVVAVGTTVVRTLESAAAGDNQVSPGRGVADLFITPGYRPQVVDALITNFHAPRTTLIALVAALLGNDWRRVYQHAIDAGYRFLSFGDAMFIEDLGAER